MDRPCVGRQLGSAIGPRRATPVGRGARRPCRHAGNQGFTGRGVAGPCDSHYIVTQLIDLFSSGELVICRERGRDRHRWHEAAGPTIEHPTTVEERGDHRLVLCRSRSSGSSSPRSAAGSRPGWASRPGCGSRRVDREDGPLAGPPRAVGQLDPLMSVDGPFLRRRPSAGASSSLGSTGPASFGGRRRGRLRTTPVSASWPVS
jgi:hypothetical protein